MYHCSEGTEQGAQVDGQIMICIRCWLRGEVLQGSLVRTYLIVPRWTLVEIVSVIQHKVMFLSSSALADAVWLAELAGILLPSMVGVQ